VRLQKSHVALDLHAGTRCTASTAAAIACAIQGDILREPTPTPLTSKCHRGFEVSTVAHDTPPATDAAVRAEQIRTLYSQSLALLVVNPLNAAIVAAVLWPWADPTLLIGWVAAMTAVTIARAGLRRRYLSAPPPVEEHTVWAHRLMWTALATGLLWGIAGAVFYQARALIPELVLVFVIGGMVAGASGTLALHLPAFHAFTASAILPVAARIFAEGDAPHMAMGVLAVVYGIAMSLLARHSNRAVTEAFRLRFENQDLLVRLSAAQVSLAETNQSLERRVTERGAALERQTEALRDAQRMESVGLLAGGVAHDFNNLLTVILGNVEMLLTDIRKAQDRSKLEEIHSAANRGATLVSQLLAFSRRQVMMRQVLDLNTIVTEVRPLLTRLIGEHIELRITLAEAALPVQADPTQIQQMIINLATNARDAMPAGGTLTIETGRVDEVPAGTTLPPGRYVMLSVRDTGVGMDTATIRMAFHPFFTTKDVGKGTGLGLASVHGIAEQSGGHVYVESELGRGSCFRVLLPRVGVETVDATAPPRHTPAVDVPQTATILIAEDEALVRGVVVRVLGSAGYTVIQAQDGEQALEIVRAHRTPIDLVISDVVMARMGGLDLAKQLAVERPSIPVLLISGYNREEMLDGPPHTIGFLQKPFTPSELLEKVASLLTVAGRPVRK
jgi:signal transduction histidine kinase/CheY-like chemotaxis protein